MFKHIRKIKGLGVFENYTQPSGINEFGVKNLIYGWNYSGKTTLSRLFSLLDTKLPNPDLPSFSFAIETDKGEVNETNYQTSPHIVRVFNSDFVTENLNFTGSSFRPILLLGSESDEAKKEIERCEAMLKRAQIGSDNTTKATKTATKKLADAKTEEAQAIKNTMSLVTFFGAVQLDKELSTIQLGIKDYRLTNEEYEADIKLARTSDQEQLKPVDKVLLRLELNDLHKQATTLLATTPNLASTIEHLVKNPLIEKWVGEALPLHTGKEICEFCGGSLDEHRMAILRAHFSKDLADHKQEVKSLLSRVNAATVSIAAQKDVEFNAQYRQRFNDVHAKVQEAVKVYNKAIDGLTDDLNRKMDTPFNVIVSKALDTSHTNNLASVLAELNLLIEENNNVATNFTTEKAAAINRLKLHFAQKFSEKVDIDGHAAKLRRLERHKKKFDWCAEQLIDQIQKLNAIISQAQRGREEINKRIENLLGSESVQIVVVKSGDQEHFQLVRRNGKIAKHLSEGEKTAIAFAFFLTKLRELKEFNEAIIYVDDPISSLDSNHIFQVTAMIKETFFYQDGETGQWKTRCKQVFLSTHNFEFFSLLRELNPQKLTQAKHYLIKRISPNESSFDNMPDSMYRYASEYHFLFDVLNEFHKAPDKTDFKVLMLLPNAVRRFVELYTFSKYPDSRNATVDQRAERIFGGEKAKRILKVLHYFSHANKIERIAENNDLMCDIERAVKDLMETLENSDPMHMEALKAAVA